MQESDLDFNVNDGPYDRYWLMFDRLPTVWDWVNFNGEDVFMGVNYGATVKAGRPMVDIYYCATEALHNNPMFITQWNKNKFKPSKLADVWKD